MDSRPLGVGPARPGAVAGSRLAGAVNVQNDDPDDIAGEAIHREFIDDAVRLAGRFAGAGHMAGASGMGIIGKTCNCGDNSLYAASGGWARSGLAIPGFDTPRALGR